MTIVKTRSFIDYYSELAKAKRDISGRGGNTADLQITSQQIIDKLSINSGDSVVDIGCGDGTALILAADAVKHQEGWSLTGILPTKEEVAYVKELRQEYPEIDFMQGYATATGLQNSYADVVICNGVLLLMADNNELRRAISEIFRITKPEGKVLIGEMPDCEVNQPTAPSVVDLSFSSRLLRKLKNEGLLGLIRRLKQSLNAKELVIVKPLKTLSISRDEFTKMLEQSGLDVIECFRPVGVDPFRGVVTSESRWSYLCIRRK